MPANDCPTISPSNITRRTLRRINRTICVAHLGKPCHCKDCTSPVDSTATTAANVSATRFSPEIENTEGTPRFVTPRSRRRCRARRATALQAAANAIMLSDDDNQGTRSSAKDTDSLLRIPLNRSLARFRALARTNAESSVDTDLIVSPPTADVFKRNESVVLNRTNIDDSDEEEPATHLPPIHSILTLHAQTLGPTQSDQSITATPAISNVQGMQAF